MRVVIPAAYDILPRYVKIMFNLWINIDNGTIFKKFNHHGFVDLKPDRLQEENPIVLLYYLVHNIVEQKNKSKPKNFKMRCGNIKYFHNSRLAERFEACKRYFESSGIPSNEKLVFHATNADAKSIFEHGFQMGYVQRPGNEKDVCL